MRSWHPDRLASLDLTGWCLAGIIGWLILGAQAAEIPSFNAGMSGMNATLVIRWLFMDAFHHPWVLAWLVVLLLLSTVLAINLAACIWLRTAKTNREGRELRFWLFLSMHLLFGLIMCIHGLEMVLGEKHPWQTVHAGDVYRPDSRWHAAVHEINFVNDPEILNPDRGKRRQSMTRKHFDAEVNFVRASLMHGGRVVKTDDIRIMDPLVHGNVHVVLRRFEYGADGLSARIRIVDAPFHTMFFTVYSLFIMSFMAWLALRVLRRER